MDLKALYELDKKLKKLGQKNELTNNKHGTVVVANIHSWNLFTAWAEY